MNSRRRLDNILQGIENLDRELGELASGCEFAKQRRLCDESKTLLQGIRVSLEKGFDDLEQSETYTGILDRI